MNKDHHKQIQHFYYEYLLYNEKFTEKKFKVSGRRARKSLTNLYKACKSRRKQILDNIN